MTIWRPIPVHYQSSLTLQKWAIVELRDKTRHFIGYCIENCEGRVSSEIESFDVNTLTGITCTGRIYKLFGEPGLDEDAQYVWNAWKTAYQIADFEEITKTVWLAHLSSNTVLEDGDATSPTDEDSSLRKLPRT